MGLGTPLVALGVAPARAGGVACGPGVSVSDGVRIGCVALLPWGVLA